MSYVFRPSLRVMAMVIGACVVQAAFAMDAPLQRAPRVNDRFAVERLGAVTFAPDGDAVAFTRRRPVNSMPSFNSMFIEEILDDVWMQDAPGRPARNLTRGQTDHSGWWAPQWSTDGRYLAMLSTRGGNITPWVWDRVTQELRQLTSDGVEFNSGLTLRWIDAHRVLCLLRPKGEVTRPYGHGDTTGAAVKAWDRALTGALTASVLNSNEFMPPKLRLVLIDVSSRQSTEIALTRETQTYNDPALTWKLAPGGNVLSVVRPLAARYSAIDHERLGVPVSVELRDLEGNEVPLRQPLPENILASTLRWSPDGQELAFFAYGDAPINLAVLYGTNAAAYMPEFIKDPHRSVANPARLYRVHVARGTVDSWGTADLDLGYLSAPQFQWTAHGELLFRAARHSAQWRELNNVPRTNNAYQHIGYGPRAPRTWWILARDGKLRPLTTKLKNLPEYLHAIDGAEDFIGASDGEVWRIDARTGAVRNLTASFGPEVTYLPQELVPAAERGVNNTRVVISARQALSAADKDLIARGAPELVKAGELYTLDIGSGTTVALQKPAAQANLSAYSAISGSSAWVADDRNGAFLWRVDATAQSKPEVLAQANLWKRGVLKYDCQRIDYTSFDNEPLHAQLCLPTKYTAGQRVPLIVDLYLTRTGMASRGDEAGLAPWLDEYPSAGYAVLIPDMPKNLPGLAEEEGQSILSLPNGVHPAVDKVIAMGIADPQRLFIAGISNGGWSVAGLLAQTARFKAALARSAGNMGTNNVAGNCLPLSYGVPRRYDAVPHNGVSTASSCKYLHTTDLPWWRDRHLNARNDPLNYAERVQTPLLLTHSDIDGVVIDSSEMFFNALVSMRKPAQFVRYWGEAHGRYTPANVRDELQRTLAWFEQWGDISRDASGDMLFEGNHVKSRHGAPPWKPEDYAKLDLFGPGGEEGNRQSAQQVSAP